MKKFFTIITMTALCVSGANAQRFLNRLQDAAKNAAENAAENAVSRNVDNKVNDAVDNAFEGGKNSSRNNGNDNNEEESSSKSNSKKSAQSSSASESDSKSAKQDARTIEATYAKCDFVSGDEVIFEDDLANEKIGEFPSKWDLVTGNSEVVKYDGKMAIGFESVPTVIAPLMKDMKKYLTDEFTIEYDFFAGNDTKLSEGLLSRSQYFLHFYNEEGSEICTYEVHTADVKSTFWSYQSTSDRHVNSEYQIENLLKDNDWNHFAISFNKRAMKAYINGTRVTNVPNMKAPSYVELESRHWQDHGVDYVTNFRICKGAVPLYDRMMTDGKFITYGITFDVNKATIKPQSMSEINRIKTLMDENPTLKFEVQGHTDNTGSAATNQTLSEQRAQAIVDKLVELGVDKKRLTAVGKGQTSPLADNSTEEGKAKNRRVEFIKK